MEQDFKCSTTLSFLKPSFSSSLLFPSCISSFLLDYSAFLLLRVQAAHSISRSLSLLPRYNSGFPLHPSINLSMHPPSLQQPTQRLIPQRERMWGEAFYSVFQLSSVLIELFCNPAPSNQAQPPLSSCLLCSSSVHGNISLIPLCFPSSRG